MKNQIQKFVNEIRYSADFFHVMHWTFIGDGNGDFEERSKSASKESLLNYIKHLEEQKELALKAIDEFYPGPKPCQTHDWDLIVADQTSNTYKCADCGKIKMAFDDD